MSHNIIACHAHAAHLSGWSAAACLNMHPQATQLGCTANALVTSTPYPYLTMRPLPVLHHSLHLTPNTHVLHIHDKWQVLPTEAVDRGVGTCHICQVQCLHIPPPHTHLQNVKMLLAASFSSSPYCYVLHSVHCRCESATTLRLEERDPHLRYMVTATQSIKINALDLLLHIH
jgi:hypothetical protein